MCETQSTASAILANPTCQGTCSAAQKAACPLLAMMAKLDMPQKPLSQPALFNSTAQPALRITRTPRMRMRKSRPARHAHRATRVQRTRRSAGFTRRAGVGSRA